jgi:hypothetical protein
MIAQKKPKNNKRKRSPPGQLKARNIPSVFQLLPPVTRCFMGYKMFGGLNEPAALAGTFYQFRLNSVYDPDFTGTGTVAQGYTAMSGIYQFFKVVGVRVIFKCAEHHSTSGTVGMVPSYGSTLTSNISLWESQPYAVSKIMHGGGAGTHSVKEFDVTFDLPRIAGLTREQYMDESDFGHAVGANPAKAIYLSIFAVGLSGSFGTNYTIRFIYDVQLTAPYPAVVN